MNALLGVSSINHRMKKPTPVPLAIRIDLVERLEFMNLTESASWFVNLVADRIADTGKHVDDLTVRELREIINDCTVAANKAAKRKLYWWKYYT